MKKLLTIMMLIFIFQSWTKAGDISEFEIEGVSIGDSFLNHFKKNIIEQNFKSKGSAVSYTDDSFLYVSIPLKNKTYEKVGIHHKKNDKNYIVYAVSGIIFYFSDFKKCLDKQNEIADDISDLLINFDKTEYKYENSETPDDRVITSIMFTNNNNEVIQVDCTNWGENTIYTDNLRIDIMSEEFINWLNTKAYN